MSPYPPPIYQTTNATIAPYPGASHLFSSVHPSPPQLAALHPSSAAPPEISPECSTAPLEIPPAHLSYPPASHHPQPPHFPPAPTPTPTPALSGPPFPTAPHSFQSQSSLSAPPRIPPQPASDPFFSPSPSTTPPSSSSPIFLATDPQQKHTPASHSSARVLDFSDPSPSPAHSSAVFENETRGSAATKDSGISPAAASASAPAPAPGAQTWSQVTPENGHHQLGHFGILSPSASSSPLDFSLSVKPDSSPAAPAALEQAPSFPVQPKSVAAAPATALAHTHAQSAAPSADASLHPTPLSGSGFGHMALPSLPLSPPPHPSANIPIALNTAQNHSGRAELEPWQGEAWPGEGLSSEGFFIEEFNGPDRVLAAALLAAVIVADASASDHRYGQGEKVPFYANKVGPFHNPSETYKFFDLPFCQPGKINEKLEDLGEVLNGDRMVQAPYELNFRVDHERTTLCKRTLAVKDVQKFRDAVMNDYYFQMYYDDLPIWGFIGKVDTDPKNQHFFLFTHVHFEVEYNNDRVVEISVATDAGTAVDITEDKEMEVEFTYSAKWKQTDKSFDKRMDKYSRYSFLPQHLEIHWFSIINSCVTVLLLTGFLATILMRVLKNDFIKYSRDEESSEEQEETGWKYIHGDVFRFPKNKDFFCAVLGSGTQLLFLVIFIFILALVGVFYPYNRGALWTALVVIYALTSGIAGYTAASFYKQMEGTNWVRNILLTGCMFCGPVFISFCFLNTVAIVYNSTNAKPFGTIVIIILIWALITFPLLVAGGIAGKKSNAEFQAPCRTTKYPREIPVLPWYRHTVPQMAMAGFLPFSAIYIELYYIFASVWGHKVYTIYSILFIVFIILIIVTAFITIALTYFQLAVEDHEWWWRSVLRPSDDFGFMACVCYGFFLMLGTVGFRASLSFVRHIYRSIKCD
ncbi:unnamed protein product [Closterium sp. Yama58-4]|nr:unnamed protein product [Closterium sp. Yama58-4]